jgi:hypothetical protein
MIWKKLTAAKVVLVAQEYNLYNKYLINRYSKYDSYYERENMKHLVFVILLIIATNMALAQPEAGPKVHTSDRALGIDLHEMSVIQNGKLLSKQVYDRQGKQTHQINYDGDDADTVKLIIYDDNGNKIYDKNWKQIREFTYDSNGYLLTETKYRSKRKLSDVRMEYRDNYKTKIKHQEQRSALATNNITYIEHFDDNGKKLESFVILQGDTIKRDCFEYIGNKTKIHIFQPGYVKQLPYLDKTIVFDSTGFEYLIETTDQDGILTKTVRKNDTIRSDKEIKYIYIQDGDIYKNIVIRFNDRGDTTEYWNIELKHRLKELTKYEYYDDGRIKSKVESSNRKFARVRKKMVEEGFNRDSMEVEMSFLYKYDDETGQTIVTSQRENGELKYIKTLDSNNRIVKYEKMKNLLNKKNKLQKTKQSYIYKYDANGNIVRLLVPNKREVTCIYDDNNLLIEKIEKKLYDNSEKINKWEYTFHE